MKVARTVLRGGKVREDLPISTDPSSFTIVSYCFIFNINL